MISISLNNLTLILGARRIFSDLSWEIQHDQASEWEKRICWTGVTSILSV